ncbi:MAG: DUF1286 domain-containing protein [Conexivisphaerales archaeon]
MKLKTHIAFSLGISTFVLRLLGTPIFETLIIAIIVALFANHLIDALGHEGHARTPLTHTPLRSIAWSLLSVPLAVLPYGPSSLPAALTAAVLAGPSHMLLDAFTEHGIYVKRNGRWRRFALAHIRSNDPIANALALLLGLMGILASLLL